MLTINLQLKIIFSWGTNKLAGDRQRHYSNSLFQLLLLVFKMFLQHNLICACFPICDFSPALVHLCSFVILIHRSRRSRFYQHLGPSWATLYSIFLNAFFIRLFERRSRERKVTLYRMAIPLLKNFGSVQYSWLLSRKKIRDRSVLATLYYVQ